MIICSCIYLGTNHVIIENHAIHITKYATEQIKRTTRHKLEHDLEQFDFYLRSEDVGKQSHGLELFRNTLPNIYRATLDRLDDAAARVDFNADNEYYIFQEKDRDIMKYYNRAMFILIPTLPLVPGGSGFLTPRDWASVERQWFGEDVHHPHPGIAVIDDLLSPQTLARVRKYLL